MKKLLLVAAVAAFTMTSCKKDYTCECTTSIPGFTPTTGSTTIHDTKSKAKDACENGTGAQYVTCKIK